MTRDSLLEELHVHCVPLSPPESLVNTTQIPVRFPGQKEPSAFALVDSEDLDKVKDFRWRTSTTGHVVSTKNRATHFLHRLIFGSPAHHLNGNFLDNRKANLTASLPRGTRGSTRPAKTK